MNNNSLPSERLRSERERLGLSQSAIAERCGVSREMWGKYERGVAKPGSDVLASMGREGVDVVFVLQGTPATFESSLGRIARATKIVQSLGLPPEARSMLVETIYGALEDVPLNERERRIVDLFRELDERGKIAIETTLDAIGESKAKSEK